MAETGKRETTMTMDQTCNLATLIKDLPNVPQNEQIANDQELESNTVDQHLKTAEFNNSRDSRMFLNQHIKFMNQTNLQTNSESIEKRIQGIKYEQSPTAILKNTPTPLSI